MIFFIFQKHKVHFLNLSNYNQCSHFVHLNNCNHGTTFNFERDSVTKSMVFNVYHMICWFKPKNNGLVWPLKLSRAQYIIIESRHRTGVTVPVYAQCMRIYRALDCGSAMMQVVCTKNVCVAEQNQEHQYYTEKTTV